MSNGEPEITLEDVYPTTLIYQPLRDEHWNRREDVDSYVQRMISGPLANWPEELLREWLHRHADDMEDYAFLDFTKLRFTLDSWLLERFPGREAFRDERFCDSFQNVEERAADNPHDWLAHYMLKEGTWNTPIALFENSDVNGIVLRPELKSPLHLLEGHRRLAFLQGLKRLNRSRSQHQVWVVRKA